jgi:Transposase DNA-binding/Transposase Tn5 dimerisation domain
VQKQCLFILPCGKLICHEIIQKDETALEEDEANWAINEFSVANLGDKRRTERLIRLANALIEQPDSSFPAAMGDLADLKGAYRFFDNPANEHEEILKSHIQSTCQRMAQTQLVLAVQDTTYLDLTHHPGTRGLGPTTSEKKQGLVMHSTLAITPERVVLGVLQERIWARDAETYAKLPGHKQRRIADKESYKWLDSLECVIELHKGLPGVHFVSVGDREADVYDLFMEERPAGVDLLVRAIRDRRIEEDEQRYLWAALQAARLAATVEVQVPRTQRRPEHLAQLEIRWKEITLRPPVHRAAEKLPSVTVWAVWANEPAPPEGAEKVEWMLLTTFPVTSTNEALERLEWYTCRWGIEVWHKVLKSGCRVESRQLDDAENIKRMLAVFSVVAWRIIYAGMLARVIPDASCSLILEAAEWQALYCTIHRTQILPEHEPTLSEAIHMIGRLGGFLGRKSDGEPGVQALWIGFRRLYDLTSMYKIMRHPDSPAK